MSWTVIITPVSYTHLSYKELAGKLTVENPQNTRILSLTVRDENPYMAKQIVDDIANTASDYIGEIMEMVPPKMIEDGVVASEPYLSLIHI